MTRHGYPRPQLERKEWRSLNGEWDFAIDADGLWFHPNDVKWSGSIQIPFAPETPASESGTSFYMGLVPRTIESTPSHGSAFCSMWPSLQGTVLITAAMPQSEGVYTPFPFDLALLSTHQAGLAVRAL